MTAWQAGVTASAGTLGTFLRAYGRTSRRRNGMDSNDRHYSRKLESEIKQMRPEDLDLPLRDEDE